MSAILADKFVCSYDLLPTVIVVSHDIDEVEVLVHLGHLIRPREGVMRIQGRLRIDPRGYRGGGGYSYEDI